jgi:hypothetical protein
LFGLGQNLSLIKGMQETVKNLPPFKMRFTVVLSLEMAGFPGNWQSAANIKQLFEILEKLDIVSPFAANSRPC